jgi:hypothetical protein
VASGLKNLAELLRMDDGDSNVLEKRGQAVFSHKRGIWQRMRHLPGRLLQGVASPGSHEENGVVSKDSDSIATHWVHFLTDNDEVASASSPRQQRDQYSSSEVVQTIQSRPR